MRAILFGPLFTQAERIWNQLLKYAIERESEYEIQVTLPQDEAAMFIRGSSIDFDGMVANCLVNAATFDMAVAILDGSDADSGTCLEIGYRKGCGSDLPVIGVRTDFRTSEDRGLNAMLRICDKVIYSPSFNIDVNALAREIIKEILALSGARTPDIS